MINDNRFDDAIRDIQRIIITSKDVREICSDVCANVGNIFNFVIYVIELGNLQIVDLFLCNNKNEVKYKMLSDRSKVAYLLLEFGANMNSKVMYVSRYLMFAIGKRV